MPLKTVGLIFLASGIAVGGWLVGERKKKSHGDLLFLLYLTEHVYAEIYYARKELPACFLSYPDNKRQETLMLFSRGKYEEALQALALTKEIKAYTAKSLASLGSGTLEEELLKVERLKEFFKSENEKSSKKLGGDVRSARVLGICIAAAILLLFL